ncbi:hypothetical protein O7A05_17520 [Mesorhizobium sp. Cs1330R2N1]|uniref:Uncharacterized protein n=1 Tax=Mesorhizobium argentiipisi TaxID=3015175 RepID=A0ABU8KE60_9HYPH
MHTRSASRKKLPLKLSRQTAAPSPALKTSGAVSLREPPRAFGRLGSKAPLAVAAKQANASGMENVAARMATYGPLTLKICVALWIVATLASVFVTVKG